MAIVLPKKAKTDNLKLAYLYRKQEKLRLWHNEAGAKFRNNEITERQWLNFLSVFSPLNYELSCNLAPIKDKQVKALTIAGKDFDLIGFKKRFKENIQYDQIIKDEINALVIPDLDLTFTDPLEDFLTYTEVDPNSRITVTSPKADVAGVRRDEDGYLYKDKGVDYFDALNILFEIYIASTSGDDGFGGMGVANTVSSAFGFADTDTSSYAYRAGAAYRIYLIRGWHVAADYYTGSANTLYYCTKERAVGNDTVNTKIYSNADRTTLLDTLAVAGFGTVKWRYVYGFVNSNTVDVFVGAGYSFTGYVQNMDLQIAPPTGHPTMLRHRRIPHMNHIGGF